MSTKFLFPGYIGTSINDGPGCLMLRCPDRDCGVAVGQAMVNVVATEEDKKKYGRYLLRSYIEDNGKVNIINSLVVLFFHISLLKKIFHSFFFLASGNNWFSKKRGPTLVIHYPTDYLLVQFFFLHVTRRMSLSCCCCLLSYFALIPSRFDGQM